ncbi:hypothetical protein ACLI4R_14430 [Natrialbaceae archaeon A-chndr2]
MSDLNRRDFLCTSGAATILGVSGCTTSNDNPENNNSTNNSGNGNPNNNSTENNSTEENGEEPVVESWDPVEEFTEYYKENEIPRENSNLGGIVESRLSKGTMDARLDGDETTYEIARTVIPRYAQHVLNMDQDYLKEGTNFIDGARHGIHNIYNIDPEDVFILEREANGTTVLGETFLNTGTKEQPEWEKDIFLQPAVNTDIDDTPDYYLINGVQPDDEASLSARQNLQGVYDSTRADMYSALDWNYLEKQEQDWSDSGWRGFDQVNDSYLPEGIDEISFTRDALERIGDIENFYREGNHNETVEALMNATGYHENELEADQYMALDIVDDELTPKSIDGETREQLITNPDHPLE